MWLYRTGKGGELSIVLYEYYPSRGGANAAAYLKDFHGYLHTDGYAGYEKVENVTRCGCWAHLRRYFIEAMPANAEKLLNITLAETGRDYCYKLFKIERDLEELLPEDRKIKRLEQEKPVLEAFCSRLEALNPLKGSHLGKAVTYAFNHRVYMENYLLDGRCPSLIIQQKIIYALSQSEERTGSIAASTQDADASATVYSLVETAKANDLNVYKHLEYILIYMPETDYKKYPECLMNSFHGHRKYSNSVKINRPTVRDVYSNWLA